MAAAVGFWARSWTTFHGECDAARAAVGCVSCLLRGRLAVLLALSGEAAAHLSMKAAQGQTLSCGAGEEDSHMHSVKNARMLRWSGIKERKHMVAAIMLCF